MKALSRIAITIFASCFVVVLLSTPVSAYKECPQRGKALTTFNKVFLDLSSKGYMSSLNSKDCSMIIEVIKVGKDPDHGLLDIDWKIKTYATILYVWTGKQYQFVHFSKLYTLAKAPIGMWRKNSRLNNASKQEMEIRNFFTVKYLIIKP